MMGFTEFCVGIMKIYVIWNEDYKYTTDGSLRKSTINTIYVIQNRNSYCSKKET